MKFTMMCPTCSDDIAIESDTEKFSKEIYDKLVDILRKHCSEKHKDSERVKKYDATHDGYPVFDENGAQRAFPMLKKSK